MRLPGRRLLEAADFAKCPGGGLADRGVVVTEGVDQWTDRITMFDLAQGPCRFPPNPYVLVSEGSCKPRNSLCTFDFAKGPDGGEAYFDLGIAEHGNQRADSRGALDLAEGPRRLLADLRVRVAQGLDQRVNRALVFDFPQRMDSAPSDAHLFVLK